MGTGIGRGENRAIEAAQQAIASPLLETCRYPEPPESWSTSLAAPI